MSATHETLVFIPAWNEEENLPAVLEELRTELPEADVLVVDDGSTDRTAEVAKEHGADILSFGENRGLRAAIAAGYGYAAEHGYAYCGRVDADGQHPVTELRDLLELVPGSTTSRSAHVLRRRAATASPASATSRARPGGSERECCDARSRSSSTGRSTTRRAGCTR
jgi:glycosyltransferase involved in cell wall biosynthesis